MFQKKTHTSTPEANDQVKAEDHQFQPETIVGHVPGHTFIDRPRSCGDANCFKPEWTFDDALLKFFLVLFNFV